MLLVSDEVIRVELAAFHLSLYRGCSLEDVLVRSLVADRKVEASSLFLACRKTPPLQLILCA